MLCFIFMCGRYGRLEACKFSDKWQCSLNFATPKEVFFIKKTKNGFTPHKKAFPLEVKENLTRK